MDDPSPRKHSIWLRKWVWLWIAAPIALALTWLLYRPVLDFNFVNYDDTHFVLGQPRLWEGFTWDTWTWAWKVNLTSPDRQVEYWMPFTIFSRLLDFKLFGADPAGHHLQSLLWHALNAWLLFVLLVQATGARGRSAVAALLWLVHPLNVETVAWISLRKDLMAGTFSMLTLLAWTRYGQCPSRAAYAIALLAFTGSIFCKPSVIALPSLLLVLDYWPLHRKEWEKGAWGWARLVAEKLPFLLLAVAAGWLAHAMKTDLSIGGGREDYALVDRIRQMLAGYDAYVQKALLPDQLCVLYPIRPPKDISNEAVLVGMIFLAALTLGFGFLAWRGHRAYAAGWLWFVLLILPVSGLVPFGRQALADRYAYVPLAGLAIVAVWLAVDLARALSLRRRRSAVCIGGCILLLLIVVAFARKSRIQLQTWRDSYALWDQVLRTERDCTVAFNNIGTALLFERLERPAGAYLRAAFKVDPEDIEHLGKMGTFYARLGKPELGARLLDRALRAIPLNVQYHRDFILALNRMGRREDARFATARLEAIRGRQFLRLALDFLAAQQFESAREQFAQAASAWLGLRRYRPGHTPELLPPAEWIELARKSLAALPESSQTRRLIEAYAAFLQSETAAAAEIFRAISAREPAWAEPRWRLALCLSVLGREDEAVREAAAAAACARPDPDGAADWQTHLQNDSLPAATAPSVTISPSPPP